MTTFKTQSAYPMIPFEEAMGILEARIQPCQRRTPLHEVEIGTVLAEDIIASRQCQPLMHPRWMGTP